MSNKKYVRRVAPEERATSDAAHSDCFTPQNNDKANGLTGDCEKSSMTVHASENVHIYYRHCEHIHKTDSTRAGNRIRLNRAIAQSGFCSRRKADELIKAGRVKVNGAPQTNPAKQIDLQDQLEINDKLVYRHHPPLYILLNKPIHTVCTTHDPQGRQTVLDLIPEPYKNVRLYPVGRLDYFSEGLLLLTNDGDLANRLMHPRHHLAKVYEATIRGRVSDNHLKIMTEGMILEDGIKLLPVAAKAKVLANGNTLLTLELRQGVNRQIRRMCGQLGLTILRLRRIGEGSLKLADLAPGKTRLLKKEEVDRLYREAHLTRN